MNKRRFLDLLAPTCRSHGPLHAGQRQAAHGIFQNPLQMQTLIAPLLTSWVSEPLMRRWAPA